MTTEDLVFVAGKITAICYLIEAAIVVAVLCYFRVEVRREKN